MYFFLQYLYSYLLSERIKVKKDGRSRNIFVTALFTRKRYIHFSLKCSKSNCYISKSIFPLKSGTNLQKTLPLVFDAARDSRFFIWLLGEFSPVFTPEIRNNGSKIDANWLCSREFRDFQRRKSDNFPFHFLCRNSPQLLCVCDWKMITPEAITWEIFPLHFRICVRTETKK